MARKATKPKMVALEPTGEDLFVVVDGVRIAQRGQPGSNHAGKWIALEPGYEVTDVGDLDQLEIRKDGVRIH